MSKHETEIVMILHIINVFYVFCTTYSEAYKYVFHVLVEWMHRFCCDTYCETKAIYINITVNNEFLDCNSVIVFSNHDIDDINVHLS